MLTIFIDMDGVLADFEKAANKLLKSTPFSSAKNIKPDELLDFSTFTPMPGAISAVAALLDMRCDVFIASTPPWDNPAAWGQKRDWIEKHLPKLKRKVFLTHRKDLLIGDILIDDTVYRGQKEFKGRFIHFGQDGVDWDYCLREIKTTIEKLKLTN